MRTAQGVAPRALLVPLAVGQRGDDLDRALDDTLHLGDVGVVRQGIRCSCGTQGMHAEAMHIGRYPDLCPVMGFP